MPTRSSTAHSMTPPPSSPMDRWPSPRTSRTCRGPNRTTRSSSFRSAAPLPIRRSVANAAHGLRSPRAALRWQAAKLEHVVTGEDAGSRVGQLRRGLQRMEHLLERLLDMAYSECGRGARLPVWLVDVAREVLAQ